MNNLPIRNSDIFMAKIFIYQAVRNSLFASKLYVVGLIIFLEISTKNTSEKPINIKKEEKENSL